MKNISTAIWLLTTLPCSVFAAEEGVKYPATQFQPRYVILFLSKKKQGKEQVKNPEEVYVVPAHRPIAATREKIFKKIVGKNFLYSLYLTSKYQKGANELNRRLDRHEEQNRVNARLYLQKAQGSAPDSKVQDLASKLTFEEFLVDKPNFVFSSIEMARWKIEKDWAYKYLYDEDEAQAKADIDRYEPFVQKMKENRGGDNEISYFAVEIKRGDPQSVRMLIPKKDLLSLEPDAFLKLIKERIPGAQSLHFYKKQELPGGFATQEEPLLEEEGGKMKVKRRGSTFQLTESDKFSQLSKPKELSTLDLIPPDICELSPRYIAKMGVLEKDEASLSSSILPPINTPEELYHLGLYEEAWSLYIEGEPILGESGSLRRDPTSYSFFPSGEYIRKPENELERTTNEVKVNPTPKSSSSSFSWLPLSAVSFFAGAFSRGGTKKEPKEDTSQNKAPSEPQEKKETLEESSK